MKSLVFKTNYFSVEAGVEAGAGVTKKPNRDAMASATVVNRNKKDHDDLVIISNKPMLEKSDVARYNAVVRKENQKPHLPRKTKKIIECTLVQMMQLGRNWRNALTPESTTKTFQG